MSETPATRYSGGGAHRRGERRAASRARPTSSATAPASTLLPHSIVSGLSVILALFYTVKKLFFSMDPPGFTTLVVAILLLSGLQLVTMGVIGEYIGRIADEVKGRPLYVLRTLIRNGKLESRP